MQRTLQAGNIFSRRNSVLNFFAAKKNTIVEVIASLLILLFVYTAISKLSDIGAFQRVLRKSPLVGNYAVLVSWTIPITELVVSILLFGAKTRRIGLFASFVLMIGFTGYLGYMLASTPNLPCSCGGVISQMNWTQHFVFNIVFTLLSLTGILLSRNSKVNSL